MRRARKLILSLVASTLIAALASCPSSAVSWTSFKLATCGDIGLTPIVDGTALSYQLVVGPSPTVTFGGMTYSVKRIKGVYAVGATKQSVFIATRGTNSAKWKWDYSKNRSGMVAGYRGLTRSYLNAGQSFGFTFGSFNAQSWNIYTGLHLVYLNARGREVSGWFKAELCPEPSSLLALGLPALGLLGVLRRQRR